MKQLERRHQMERQQSLIQLSWMLQQDYYRPSPCACVLDHSHCQRLFEYLASYHRLIRIPDASC